jgi:hypothetical protein
MLYRVHLALNDVGVKHDKQPNYYFLISYDLVTTSMENPVNITEISPDHHFEKNPHRISH